MTDLQGDEALMIEGGNLPDQFLPFCIELGNMPLYMEQFLRDAGVCR
jgi:hypothetical protein